MTITIYTRAQPASVKRMAAPRLYIGGESNRQIIDGSTSAFANAHNLKGEPMNNPMTIKQAEKLLTDADGDLTDTQRADVTAVTSQAMIDAALNLSGHVGKTDALRDCVKHSIVTHLHTSPTCDQLTRSIRLAVGKAFPHEEISQKGTPAKYGEFKYWRDTLVREAKALAEVPHFTGYTVKVDRDRSKGGTNDYLITVGPFTAAMLDAETKQKTADKEAAEVKAVNDAELLSEAMAAETARTPITMLAQQLRDYAAETFKGADLVALADAFKVAVTEDVAKAGSVKPAQPAKAAA